LKKVDLQEGATMATHVLGTGIRAGDRNKWLEKPGGYHGWEDHLSPG